MDPKLTVREGYDRISLDYRADDFDYASSEYARFLPWLQDRLGRDARVLDLGCGCGVPVAEILAREHRVTGVDFSPVQIERARKRVPEAEFLCADMSALDFDVDSFDAIVSFYAIIHVPLEEQRELIRAFARWLRPGGTLLASVGLGEWTGTGDFHGALMYWSHTGLARYGAWLNADGFELLREGLVPEGVTAHPVLLAERSG